MYKAPTQTLRKTDETALDQSQQKSSLSPTFPQATPPAPALTPADGLDGVLQDDGQGGQGGRGGRGGTLGGRWGARQRLSSQTLRAHAQPARQRPPDAQAQDALQARSSAPRPGSLTRTHTLSHTLTDASSDSHELRQPPEFDADALRRQRRRAREAGARYGYHPRRGPRGSRAASHGPPAASPSWWSRVWGFMSGGGLGEARGQGHAPEGPAGGGVGHTRHASPVDSAAL